LWFEKCPLVSALQPVKAQTGIEEEIHNVAFLTTLYDAVHVRGMNAQKPI